MSLPPALEELVLARFDKLLAEGEILYEPARVDVINVFNFQFQIATTFILQRKPVLDPNAEGRSKAVGPFVDPPLSFIVANIGTTHRLIINKFCVYRPMLVLHTREFELQIDDLNETDLAAAWSVLKAFETPQMVIYNCGVQSGSSQGHKHLQVFPRNGSGDHMVRLWPEAASSTEEITANIPRIRFAHFVKGIPPEASASHVFTQYQNLLAVMRTTTTTTDQKFETESGKADYNLVLVADWMVLIPRRTKAIDGLMMGNAATMVGLVWSHTDELRETLLKMGDNVLNPLMVMGIPLESAGSFPSS